MKIMEYIPFKNGRMLNIFRTSFICISFTVKRVREMTRENIGYALGFSFSFLWLQSSMEVFVWEKWQI